MVSHSDVTGRVAVIRIDNPPVNGLSHATREGIVRDLAAALADDTVRGIVLTGRPKFFSAGADISEFGTPKSGSAPGLGEVIRALEDATKPVVAGSVAGLASAAFAATLYASNCINDSPLFVAAWYTTAIAVVTIAGGLLGSRLLRW